MAKSTHAVEVMGIVDSRGGGAHQSQGKPWELDLQFSHWRIVGGPIEDIPLYVSRQCTEPEIRPWMKLIQPFNMLRVRVTFTRSIVPEQRRAKLVEFIGKDRSDTELRAAAKDRRAPKIEDPFFKTLVLDRRSDRYVGKRKWMARSVELTVSTEGVKDINKVLRKAEGLWSVEKETDGRIRECAINDLLDLKNDSWLEGGEKPITKMRFNSKLKLQAIIVSGDGAFEFVFDDGGMFWGHDVVVHGTIARGPQRAEIEG